jgi:hypothetical protein
MALVKFTMPRFLLCEGDDDKGFLETLIQNRGLPGFQVCHAAECNSSQTGGKAGFAASLRGFEALSGFADVKAFLLVADNDIRGTTFAEVRRALSDNGHTPPASPTAIGALSGKPVAILMIPTADREGDLESLCLPTIYEKWPRARLCVWCFLRCTGAIGWGKRSSLNKARARSAIVGFNEDDPYKGIGHLFRNGTLSVRHRCFDDIANFLTGFDAMVGI